MKFFFKTEIALAIIVLIAGISFYITYSYQRDNVYNVRVIQNENQEEGEPVDSGEKETPLKKGDVESALEVWLNVWGVTLEDFHKTGESQIIYPFNEVLLDGRENRIPNFEKATALSPNKERWVNYLYNYENKGLSGVVLFNPRGEKRLFRIAFCNNYCNYHFAEWIDDDRFVVGAYKKDVDNCSESASTIKDCPNKLFYLIYDLEAGVVQEFTSGSSFNIPQEEISEKICPIYPPCGK